MIRRGLSIELPPSLFRKHAEGAIHLLPGPPRPSAVTPASQGQPGA
jgi:hypothetical protein